MNATALLLTIPVAAVIGHFAFDYSWAIVGVGSAIGMGLVALLRV